MSAPVNNLLETPDDATLEQWYVACAQNELRKNKPYRAKILGLNLVLFRQRDGRAAALLDQCVHRGTRLSAGKIADDCLVCPYHGWRYDAEGQVVHIPSVGEKSCSSSSPAYRYRQRHFAVQEQDGLIWVYTGKGDPQRKAPFKLPVYGEKPWQSYFMINTFEADVGSLVQNFMDVPHTVFVHEGIFRSSTGRTMEATLACKAQSIEVTYHDDGDKIGILNWLSNPDGEPMVHTDRFLHPTSRVATTAGASVRRSSSSVRSRPSIHASRASTPTSPTASAYPAGCWACCVHSFICTPTSLFART